MLTLALYGMDYKYGDNHKQFYVVASTELQAMRAAEKAGYKVTSCRKINIPILISEEV